MIWSNSQGLSLTVALHALPAFPQRECAAGRLAFCAFARSFSARTALQQEHCCQ